MGRHMKAVTENLEEFLESAWTVDDHDNAIIGIVYDYWGNIPKPVVAYNAETIICNLMSDGMSHGEALAFFEFNIARSYMGIGSPIFVWTERIKVPRKEQDAEDKMKDSDNKPYTIKATDDMRIIKVDFNHYDWQARKHEWDNELLSIVPDGEVLEIDLHMTHINDSWVRLLARMILKARNLGKKIIIKRIHESTIELADYLGLKDQFCRYWTPSGFAPTK